MIHLSIPAVCSWGTAATFLYRPSVNSRILTFLAIVAAFSMTAAGSASAGEQTITSGPAYSPSTAFSNSTIQGYSLRPDTIRFSGNTIVTPMPSSTASITFTGRFTGFAGERGTAAYSFVVDSNVSFPVQFVLEGNANDGQGMVTAGTILPGLHQYRGTFEASAPTLTYTVRAGFTVTINFFSGAEAAPSRGTEARAAGTMVVWMDQFDIQLATSAVAVIPPAQLLNISTRLAVQTGENVLIAGFIVTGDVAKRVLIRGLGPSLAASNVLGALQNPLLELDGGTLTNDNWKMGGQQGEIEATGIPPSDDRESAMLVTLNPGAHTAVLRGVNNITGIGLIEVYDLEQAVNAKLANISSRGFVQTDDVMIGGFILGPASNSSSTVVVRAIGPSLGSHGVANPLANPALDLRDSQGTSIVSNDDWQQGTDSATIADRGLAPENLKESALLAIPGPGNYTAILSGMNNTAGVGSVEVYQLQ
jgi:hypothetical protein